MILNLISLFMYAFDQETVSILNTICRFTMLALIAQMVLIKSASIFYFP